MRQLLLKILTILVCLISCTEKRESKQIKSIKKYYLFHEDFSHRIDTIQFDKVNKEIDSSTRIIDSIILNFQNDNIRIKKITNINPRTDGEYIAFWEKSVGMFYLRSLAWNNFIVLQTDNDSINKFITVLMGNVLLSKKMYLNPDSIKPLIKFEAPKVEDK